MRVNIDIGSVERHTTVEQAAQKRHTTVEFLFGSQEKRQGFPHLLLGLDSYEAQSFNANNVTGTSYSITMAHSETVWRQISH